jgi:hypothetical protein
MEQETEKKSETMVPFKVYEAEIRRSEKREYRHIFVHVVMAVLILLGAVFVWLNNLRWLNYVEQYDFADYSYEQDGEGINIIGERNGVDYYEPTPEDQDTN